MSISQILKTFPAIYQNVIPLQSPSNFLLFLRDPSAQNSQAEPPLKTKMRHLHTRTTSKRKQNCTIHHQTIKAYQQKRIKHSLHSGKNRHKRAGSVSKILSTSQFQASPPPPRKASEEDILIPIHIKQRNP